MKFTAQAGKKVASPKGGYVQFDQNGSLETSDKALIESLKKAIGVKQAKETPKKPTE